MEYYINGLVTLDDYIQFHKLKGKYKIYILPSIYIILFLIGFHLLASIILFGLGIFRIINNLIKRNILKSEYNSYELSNHNQIIKINKENILIEIGSSSYSIGISNFNKVIKDRDSFYIVSKDGLTHIIKKRFLENKNDFELIIRFINQYFENKN